MQVSATTFARLVCSLLFLVAASLTLYAFLQKDNRLALKLIWVSAIIGMFALQPARLPFFSENPTSLIFFRNMFFVFSLLFLALDLFIIIHIQLPQERYPRFSGFVRTASTADKGPVISYRDASNVEHAVVDRYAMVLFPGRTFKSGQRVTVIALKPENAHIDYSFLSRWDTAIVLNFLILCMLTFGIACQIKYAALG